MTMTLELPEAGIELDTTTTPVIESQDAAEAVAMLEVKGDVGDDISIVLVKDIDDAANDFHATKGQTFTAAIDAEGDTYIPIPVSLGSEHEEGRVYLEAEEFEVVELASGCAEATSDQAATARPQTEPAGQPKTDAEIKTAAQFQPGSVTPAAVVVADGKQPSARSRYLLSKANLEESISALTIEEAKLKSQAKRAKKEREVLTKQLIDLIDAWEHQDDHETASEPATAGGSAGQIDTVSDQSGVVPESPASLSVPVAEAATDATSEADDVGQQDRYRTVLEAAGIAELGLPAKVEKKLVEAGASTIWQLEQLRGEISLGHEKWPKGIGAAKITAVENAISQWVARNAEQWERPQHQLPRTPEQIEEINRRLAEKQDQQRAAEVAEASPDHRFDVADCIDPDEQRPSDAGCSIDDL